MRDGTIHTFVCPRGHASQVVEPLLIFRPGEARPVLYALGQWTMDEQDREIAGALLGRLAESLGDAWRNEWLAEDIAVPHAVLAAVLDGADPKAAVAAALEKAILPGLAALGSTAGVGPDVPEAYWVDVARAETAEERYLSTGDHAALDEAAAAWERVLNDPGFAGEPEGFQLMTFNNAAGVFLRRYWTGGRLPDLNRALALWRDAVARTPADSPYRAAIQNNLGNGLRSRYARTGQLVDLYAAIVAYEDAVAHTPADSPDRASYMNNLGNGLRDRYLWTGRREGLDKAIVAFKDAVARTPADVANHAMYLSNLGAGLLDRYTLTGRPADLDEAIVAFEDAVVHTPADSPERARHLNNLGNGLSARYARTGWPEDLDAAIVTYEDAVARMPADSPDRAMCLNNLGDVLHARYTRTGQPADLAAAIAAHEDALARTPTDSPDRAMYQSNLGLVLHARYTRTGQPADLAAAIVAHKDAVAHTPTNAPRQAMYLSNLGVVLRDRYARTGQPADLDAAITAVKDALARTSADAPERAMHLNNLGTGLRDRYRLKGQAADLDAAIDTHRDAVARVPDDAPSRALYLNNLGAGLRDRYARTGRLQDLDAAAVAFRDAVALAPADSPGWAMYQNNLGTVLSDRYARTGRPEDLDAAIAAYEDALAALDHALLDSPVAFVLGQQARWTYLYHQAADTLLLANRPADALAAAEGGKSRLLAGLVGRGELPAPAEVPAELAARERELAGQLNAVDAAELAGRGAVGETDRPGRPVADRAALVAALRGVWGEMAAHDPAAAGYVAGRRGDRPAASDLADLAAGLGPGAALLSLFVTAEGTRLFLWRATADAPVVVEAAIDSEELAYDTLANYEDEVLNWATMREMGRPLTQRWRALGRPLLGPLLPHLDGVTRLVIAPEGVYHQLPLHALWLDDAGTTLIDRCAVSYAPALGVLERLRRQEWAETRLPAIDSASGAAVFGYTHRDDPVERALFLGEAQRVAERVGATARLDGDADGAALEAATAGPLRLLHLSCHGFFDPGDALRSGVLLADGVYAARRFLARRLPVDLVTLSACQTAISGSLGGDEMAGLSMALLTAGARSLLLGLWSVNAATTAAMMDDFYGRFLGQGAAGTDKAEALRQTMLALRDGRLIPPQPGFDPGDPYYWAPFVLVGDWR